MDSILLPRTVFFDTNHLINLAKVRSGQADRLSGYREPEIAAYNELCELLRTGFIVPAISFMQPEEWSPEKNPAAALEIAAVIDSSLACREIASLQITFVLEVLEELKRIRCKNSWRLPSVMYDAFTEPPWLTFLIENVPSYRDEWRKTGLIGVRMRKRTMQTRLQRRADIVRTDGDESRARFEWFSRAFGISKADDSPDQCDPVGASLDRVVRSPMGREFLAVEFPGEDVRQLIESIDLQECESLRHWGSFWRRYVRGKKAAVRTDNNDVTFFPAHVYSDYSITERQMRHFLHETDVSFKQKVFDSPSELVDRIIKPT